VGNGTAPGACKSLRWPGVVPWTWSWRYARRDLAPAGISTSRCGRPCPSVDRPYPGVSSLPGRVVPVSGAVVSGVVVPGVRHDCHVRLGRLCAWLRSSCSTRRLYVRRGRLCVRRVASVFQCGCLYVGNGCHVRLWSLRGRVGCRVGGVGAGRVVVHRPTLTRSTFGSRSNRLEIGGSPRVG
jgi:hypothetical protein